MPGYFTNGRSEQAIERLMRERPEPEAGKKQGKVIVKRCVNCSAYDKEAEKCRLPSCSYEQDKECESCPYKKDICNVCYRRIIKGK